jgi:eukaryotic-like serine/threonine-protein kinase
MTNLPDGNARLVEPAKTEHLASSAIQPGQSHSARRDLRDYLEGAGNLAETVVSKLLWQDQMERWQEGQRVPAEAYLQLHPGLQNDDEAAFELVYNEFVLRESRGESPTVEEFNWRFPRFADRLRRQLDLHYAFQAAANASDPEHDQPAAGAPEERGGDQGVAGPALPGYRILAELGRGGMGVVYKAWQSSLKRLVALKVIRAGSFADRDVAARFRAEAELAARFQHPNIVQVYEVGEHEGVGYLALEFVPGGSLHEKLAGLPHPAQESARLLEVLARAVHYAHQRGIVHRDLKPANVVLTEDGVPKITDFGLAKLQESSHGLTHTGAILGTPSYMAPEQARGLPAQISPATDIYALGAILYETLTGRPPFQGATPLSTLEQALTQEPVSPSRLQRQTPRDLEVICLKCLEKEPRRRYPSAEHLADDLQRFLAGHPIAARPASALERTWKWAKRRPGAATSLASACIAVVLLLAGALFYNGRLRTAVRIARAAEGAASASARAAIEQRNLTLNALNQLVFDVQEKLGNTPQTRSVRRSLLDTAIAGLDEIARSTEHAQPDLSRAVAHQKLGDIFRRIGRGTDARRQYELSLKLADELAAAKPRDIAIAECLREASIGLGELSLTGGHPGEARRHFLRAVDHATVITEVDPMHAGARRGLIQAYLEVGRAYGFEGAYADGEAWFQKSRAKADQWVSEEPESTLAKDLVASSYRKLADMQKLTNHLAAAREDYLKAIKIGEQLVEADRGNTEFKTHLAIALVDLADISHTLGSLAEARDLYRQAGQLWEALVEADPEDLEAQLRLVQARFRFARLERDDGNFEQAAAGFRQAFNRLSKLDHEGRLDGRPSYKISLMSALKEELAYSEAAPQALRDIASVKSQPAVRAARLLRLRARTLAAQGHPDKAAQAADALYALEANDAEDLYRLAENLASFLGDLDRGGLPQLPAPVQATLRQRCADRAITDLTRAVERGFKDLKRLETARAFAPIRKDPRYQELMERLKQLPR